MNRFFAIMIVWLTVGFTIRSVQALDPQPPHGVGPLPDLSQDAKSAVTVTCDQIDQYRSILPPEVADLVGQGELSFDAALKLRDPERFSGVSLSATSDLRLTGAGEVKSVPAHGLEAMMFDVPLTVEGDRKQLAYKVLWNSVAALWRYRSFAVDLSASLFDKPLSAAARVQLRVERIYPLSLGETPGTLTPIFREKISATKPDAIKNLSWLTLRFFGTNDDYLWGASPVIRKIRQLSGSNRADRIFSRAFAPDELFVWSGKVESVEPQSIALVPLLVAIMNIAPSPVSVKGDCREGSFQGSDRLALNADSNRFKGAGGWVPSGAVMVLRNVWRIDLTTRDPYSRDARQTVYFDAVSGLPVYRVVWDAAGRMRSISGGVMRPVLFQDKISAPMWAGEWIVNMDDSSRLALIAESLEWCAGVASGRALADFDPASFVRFESPPVPTKKPLK